MQPRPHRDPPPRQRFAHGLHVPPRHPEGHHSRLGQTAGMGEHLYPGQPAQTLRRPAGQGVFMAQNGLCPLSADKANARQQACDPWHIVGPGF